MENEFEALVYRFFYDMGLDMTDEQIERTVQFFNEYFQEEFL